MQRQQNIITASLEILSFLDTNNHHILPIESLESVAIMRIKKRFFISENAHNQTVLTHCNTLPKQSSIAAKEYTIASFVHSIKIGIDAK